MRVSKTVREYIENEVTKRVYVKYEAEKNEADRQNKAVKDFIHNFEKVLEEAGSKFFAEHFEEVSDFCEDARNERTYELCRTRIIQIKDKHINTSTNVHFWDSRARTEAMKIANEIIVNLELGGTKADLDRMLSEI